MALGYIAGLTLLLENPVWKKRLSFFATVGRMADPKDNFLLAFAKDGNATHLITGDKELLSLKKFGKTRIVTIGNYIVDKIKHYRRQGGLA